MMVELDLLRAFLKRKPAQSYMDLLVEGLVYEDPGTLQVLNLCRALRGNVRSRVPLWRCRRECLRVNTVGFAGRPKAWLVSLGKSALALAKAMRVYAYPVQHKHGDRHLTDVMRRKTRRAIGKTGAVNVELPTLEVQAKEALAVRRDSLVNQDVVVWVDNWYWQRFRQDPEGQDISHDLTAMAVLNLTAGDTGPADRTRSRTFAAFPGHPTLWWVVGRVDTMDTCTQLALTSLVRHVGQLIKRPLSATAVRVPLDIPRPARRRQLWEPLALSQSRVGVGTELLTILEDIRRIQRHVGGVVPLLVDEKVHHQVMRLLYSPLYWDWDCRRWLRQVPVLYGVWHPYKQTVALVYRRFLPIFAALEQRSPPRAGTLFKAARRTAFMEKMVAALLLASSTVRSQVHLMLSAVTSPGDCWKTQLRHTVF